MNGQGVAARADNCRVAANIANYPKFKEVIGLIKIKQTCFRSAALSEMFANTSKFLNLPPKRGSLRKDLVFRIETRSVIRKCSLRNRCAKFPIESAR